MNLPKTPFRNPLPRWAPAAALLLAVASGAGAQVGWWNRNWQYRRAVDVPAAQPTRLGGDDIAVVEMPTGGLILPDGGDVRVTTAGRTEVPCRVLMVGPGDFVRVAFAVRGAGNRYLVYFGNPKPDPPKDALDLRRGVLMETWLYPGGGIKTLAQVQQVFDRTKRLLGRDFRANVFVGHNPFGPESSIATRFTAWLSCPAAGAYQFACSSQDASFLVIDDKEVVANGGHHSPQTDIRMRGIATLTKGLHKLTFYHVNVTGSPVAVAAWQAPGDKRVWPIPAKAFAPVLRATPGELEQYGKSVTVDFLPRHGGETFVQDRYYQRWTFEAVFSGRPGRDLDLKWDFGDGQHAAAPKCEHVYLVPGEYTVTLTAKTFSGELTRKDRIFVSRPWDQVADNRLDGVKEQAGIVQGYDFAALDAKANAEAILLLDRAKSSHALRKAGAALLARPQAPGPLLELAVPLYAQDLPAPERLAAYLKAEKMTSSPAVCARMAEQAGQTALRYLGDSKTATEAFQRVVGRYGKATTDPAVRRAKIGLGDVWRSQGDLEKARQAYTTAGYGKDVTAARLEIVKGDYARHVEDYIRKALYADAADSIEQWASDLPLDKLEGYWSLLVVERYMKLREYDAALLEARTLVKVNPTSNYAARLLMTAAEACGRLGKDDDRKAALRQIVEKYPESPLAAEAAGLLKR